MKKLTRYVFYLFLVSFLLINVFTYFVWSFRVSIADWLLSKRVFMATVTVKNVYFDPFSQFPYTYIKVKGLRVLGTNPKKPSVVIYIHEAESRINFFKLLTNRKYKFVELIKVNRGHFNIQIDKNNVTNFKLFVPRRKPEERPDSVRTGKILIYNSRVRMNNLRNGRDFAYHVDSIGMEVHVAKTRTHVKAKANALIHYMDVGKFKIFEHRKLKLDWDIAIERKTKTTDFYKAITNIGGTDFHITGRLSNLDHQIYDLNIEAPEGNIATLLSFIPKGAAKQIQSFDAKGNLWFKGMLKGHDTATENPHFELRFGCKNASIKNIRTGAEVTGFKIKGLFSNGLSNSVTTTYLQVDTVSGMLGHSPFEGRIKLTDFKDLHIDGRLVSNVVAKEVLSFAGMKYIYNVNGEVAIDIKLIGRLKNLMKPRTFDKLTYQGSLQLKNVGFRLKNVPVMFDNMNGYFVFNGSGIKADGFGGLVNRQGFKVSGEVTNLVPYLLKNQSKLQTNVSLDVPVFNVSAFLKNYEAMGGEVTPTKGKKHVKTKKNLKWNFDLPENLELNMKINCAGVTYNNLRFGNVVTGVTYKNKILTLGQMTLTEQAPGSVNAIKDFKLVVNAQDTGFHKIDLQFVTDFDDPGRIVAGVNSKPTPATRPMEQWDIKAKIMVSANVQKRAPEGQKPKIDIRLAVSDGAVNSVQQKDLLKDASLVVNLNQNNIFDFKTSSIVIDSVYCLLKKYPLHAKIKIDDFVNKRVTADVNSDIAAPTLLTYVKTDWFKVHTGQVQFQVRLQGKLSDFTQKDKLFTTPQYGDVRISDLSFNIKNNPMVFDKVNVDVKFDTAGVTLKKLTGRMGNTHFEMNGWMKDLMNYLFLKDKPLIGNVTFKADSIDIESILSKTPTKKTKKSKDKTIADSAPKKQTNYFFKLPQLSDLKGNIEVKYAEYGRLKLYNTKLSGSIVNRYMTLDSLVSSGCDGRVKITGILDARSTDSIRVNTKLKLTGLDVRKTLWALKNFNQKFITDSLLSGNLSATVNYKDVIPAHLQYDLKNSQVKMNFNLVNGCLYNFKPLLKLKGIINKNNLDTVPFTMNGQGLVFQNNKLTIPKIDLHSTILNVLVKGDINAKKELHLKLAATFTSRKDRTRPPNLFSLFAGSYEKTLLCLRVDGSDKHYKPKIDWQSMLEHFKNIGKPKDKLLVPIDTTGLD